MVLNFEFFSLRFYKIYEANKKKMKENKETEIGKRIEKERKDQ